MPTKIETLERRIAKLTEQQFARFEKLEQRVAEMEREGLCELWTEVVEMERRLRLLERKPAPKSRKRKSRRR